MTLLPTKRRRRRRVEGGGVVAQEQPRRRPRLCLFLLCFFLLDITAAASSSSKTCYYDRLGVSKTASATELKRSYRKLALKHHPDKGGDPETFKELTQAYDTLKDPDQRQIYDQYGPAGVEAGSTTGGGFGGMNNGGSPFFGGGGNNPGFSSFSFASHGGPSQQQQGNNGPIDLSDILKGMMGGNAGGGLGGLFGGGGSPTRSNRKRRQRQQRTYDKPVFCTLEELATGATKKLKVRFPTLGERLYTIQLTKGWKEGTKVTYPSKNSFPKLVFTIQEKKHRFLRRVGHDLHYTCYVTKAQQERGGIHIKVPLPAGDTWETTIDKRIEHTKNDKSTLSEGERMVIPDKGMPIKGGPKRGKLIVTFRIRKPSKSA